MELPRAQEAAILCEEANTRPQEKPKPEEEAAASETVLAEAEPTALQEV